MRRIASLATFLALTAFVYWTPSQAQACSCMQPPPPQKAAADSVAVFEARSFSHTAIDSGRVRYDFEVTRVWKGEVGATTSIVTANNSAACGRVFREGVSYVIYAHKEAESGFHDGLCSRTREIESASEDLAALGEGVAPGAPPKDAPETPTEPPRIDPEPTAPSDPSPAEPSARGCRIGEPAAPASALGLLALLGLCRRRQR